LQFVAKTQSAHVVLVLSNWFENPLTPDELERRFLQWTRVGYLDRTWLPPSEDYKVLGPLAVAPESEETIWMRGKIPKSADSPNGWFIQRDYQKDDTYHSGYSEREFAELYPDVDQSKLAPWSVAFSALYWMKQGTREP
jgi:hypothetical protein